MQNYYTDKMILIFLFAISTGVIITDNVLIYTGELSTALLNTADTVTVIESNGDFLRINYQGYMTDVHQDVCIDLSDEIGPEMLLIFGKGYLDTGEYKKAVDLLRIFIDICETSRYRTEALFLLGCAQGALSAYPDFVDTLFPDNTDAMNLMELGDQNRVLYESSGKAKYKKKAIKYYKKIIKKYDRTYYAAWAQVSIFEMKNNKKLY